ncbi:MAG: hypothetical protein MJ151_01980, partial [Lachnospiraceae bacterium]|nr:hypothetical protein [Lachnospiraceae bacterium]
GKTARVYKRGIYPDTEVWLGDDYEKLYYISEQNHREGNIDAYYNLQYVAHDKDAAADRVFLSHIPDIFQVWQGPNYIDPTSTAMWSVKTENTKCKISTTSYVILTTHMHMVNGEQVFFRGASSIEQLMSSSISEVIWIGNSLAAEKVDFGTFTDRKLHLCLDNACLNFIEGKNVFDVTGNDQLLIEDCHYHGGIGSIGVMGSTDSDASFLVAHDNADVVIHDINVASTATTKGLPIFEVKGNATIHLSTMSIMANTFAGPIIYSHGDGAKVALGKSFKATGNIVEKDSMMYAFDKGMIEVEGDAYIADNKADKGGVIKLASYSTFKVSGTINTNNNYADKGGYVYMDNTANLESSTGVFNVENSEALLGGGVYLTIKEPHDVFNDTSYTYNIKNNKADIGGGIYIDPSTDIAYTLTLDNPNKLNILSNKANYGAGLAVGKGSESTTNKLTIADINIAHNIASISGGGIYYDVEEGKGFDKVVFTKTKIEENEAKSGAALIVVGKATEGQIDILDVECIKNNIHKDLIYVDTTIKMEGVKVKGNKEIEEAYIGGSGASLITVKADDSKVDISNISLEDVLDQYNISKKMIVVEKDINKTLDITVSTISFAGNHLINHGIYIENALDDGISKFTFNNIIDNGVHSASHSDIIYMSSVSVPTVFNDLLVNGTVKNVARINNTKNLVFNDTKVENATTHTDLDTGLIEIGSDSEVVFTGYTDINNNTINRQSIIKVVGERSKLIIKKRLKAVSNTSNATEEDNGSIIV